MASNSDLFNKLFGGRGQGDDKPKGPLFSGTGKSNEPPQVRSAFGSPGPDRPIDSGPGRSADNGIDKPPEGTSPFCGNPGPGITPVRASERPPVQARQEAPAPRSAEPDESAPSPGRTVKPTRSSPRIEADSSGTADIDTHLDYIMDDLFKLVVDEKGSDLHLSIAAPPVVRIHGKMVRTKLPALNKENMRHLLYSIMNDDQRAKLEQNWEIDFSLQVPGLCRFRCNVFFQKDGLSGVFRVIPTRTPTLQELNMPSIIMDIARKHKGLVLITGPTGHGKSTTLAAMINLINNERPEHIITIEDPIEFTHEHKMCIINQREVGQNTKSFSTALRSALREDPDIILVGELRDLETIQMALTAAETGHLVFGTLHTSSAYKTIDRIIDVFPPHQQEQIRVQLSETLQAVVAQQLIPVIDGTGRVCAQEILINSSAIANLIREGKTYQIFSVLQTSKQQGMQTMDQSLKDLLKHRKITYDEAYKRATDKKSFERG